VGSEDSCRRCRALAPSSAPTAPIDEEISPDEARQELLSIMPAGVANMSLNAWAAAIGQPAFVTSTVADITGVPARPFADWVADHSAEFRA
jgi:hypothetical protein